MSKLITKSEYKDTIKSIKNSSKEDIRKARTQYKGSGKMEDDHLNSIYVRDIYYGVTLANLKRHGVFKFFLGKMLAEIRYRYRTSIKRPANLESLWYWPVIPSLCLRDIVDTAKLSTKVTNAMYAAEKELIKAEEDGKIVASGKAETVIRNEEAKTAKENFANGK